MDQLTQVGDHHVSPIVRQRVGLSFSAYSNHEPKSAVPAGLDAGNSVFDDDGTLRRYTKLLRGGEKCVRRRLPAKMESTRRISVYSRIE